MDLKIVFLVVTLILAPIKASPTRWVSFHNATSFVVGGQEAAPHEFPFMVWLTTDAKYFCGGTIIDAVTVLTAAHCLERATVVTVTAGAHNISNGKEETQVIVSSVQFIVHEGWDSFYRSNDIAVVKLPAPLEFNDFVQPISRASFEPNPGAGTRAMGWGSTTNGGSEFSDVLHVTNVISVISHFACEVFFGPLDPNVLCIDGGTPSGLCNGDSGGPLIDLNLELVGVSAFFSPTCNSGLPYVFTSVPAFKNWIDQHSG